MKISKKPKQQDGTNFNKMIDSLGIPIIWEDKKYHNGSYFTPDAYYLLERFVEGFNKRYTIRDIEVHIDFTKNSAQKIKFFEVKIHIQLANGKLLIGHALTRNILAGIRIAISKIKHESEKIIVKQH